MAGIDRGFFEIAAEDGIKCYGDRFGDESNLPDLLLLLQDRKINGLHHSILAIQARCEFYNYDIFHSPPPEISPSSTGLTVYGDYVAGDKTQGDKIQGNKTENNFPNATEVKIFERVENYHQTQDSSS
jgi:hypothetical protein